MKRPLSAGSIVETKCTRCRIITNHTIVAMVGERIVRVECNTCHGTHAFHPVKTPKEAEATTAAREKKAAARRPKTDPEAAAREEWASLERDLDPQQAVPYAMNGIYRLDAVMLHPTFGLGIVKAVLPPNKISVLFKDGRKLLRCG